jgi:hypothetical protein
MFSLSFEHPWLQSIERDEFLRDNFMLSIVGIFFLRVDGYVTGMLTIIVSCMRAVGSQTAPDDREIKDPIAA